MPISSNSRLPVASAASLFFCLIFSSMAGASLTPIQLDGYFEDWSPVTIQATDIIGDEGSSGIDFNRAWVTNDQDYLYIRFETTAEVQPDEGQQIRLYLDTDMDTNTGSYFNGIGAELIWEFGWREGTFRVGSTNYTLNHDDIGLLVGPTVSNTEFEIAIARDAIPGGGHHLFSGDTVRFLLRDYTTGGDAFPNTGGINYTFSAGDIPVPSLPLEKEDPSHIRVTTYNIEGDGLVDGGTREDALARVFQSIDADVWIINEVWDSSATTIRNKVEQFLPSGAGEAWYAIKRDAGNVVVSRYPITYSWEVFPGHRITAVLLDLGPDHELDLLVLANHWRCCTADDLRQDEADAVIEFLRDMRTAGGVISLPEGTPVVLGGDLNLVGWRQQLETLLTGDIQDEGSFGPDSAPDWDGSHFIHPLTRQPDARHSYTWRKDWSSYYPGMLDWILYTGSALNLHNHFILETRTMTASTLSAYGLAANDTEVASDHAPRSADFTLAAEASPVPDMLDLRSARLLPNIPNPFNPSTVVRFELDVATHIDLDVFNMRGHRVNSIASGNFAAGSHGITWNGTDESGHHVASGVYYAVLRCLVDSEMQFQTRSMVLIE
jgi:endonuclease/exonuclease/phosphatase family metal-dependent hydrolase